MSTPNEGRESGPRARRRARRRTATGRAFPDPWARKPDDTTTCLRTYGVVEDLYTGERRVVHRGCDRKDCPICGPQRLRQVMAHYKKNWPEREAPILYCTLHLRPEDHDRLDEEGAVAALKNLFSSRLVRRIERAEGRRPRHLGQVDRNGGRFHLHAMIETDLDPAKVAFMWADAGGALDHDIQIVGPTGDDVARTVGYVLKGGRFAGTGRPMGTQSFGYHSEAAKADRARYRDETYGEQRAREQFHLFEPDVDRPPPEPRPPRPKPLPFEPAAPLPGTLRSPVIVAGARYEIVTRLDKSAGRVTVGAVELRAGKPPRTITSGHSSKAALRRYLRHRSAAVRQRPKGREGGGEFASILKRRAEARHTAKDQSPRTGEGRGV